MSRWKAVTLTHLVSCSAPPDANLMWLRWYLHLLVVSDSTSCDLMQCISLERDSMTHMGHGCHSHFASDRCLELDEGLLLLELSRRAPLFTLRSLCYRTQALPTLER